MSDLSQEQLLSYVDLAIEALTPTLGHRMMIADIQKYLKAQWQIEESLQRIKDAETIIYELKNKES